MSYFSGYPLKNTNIGSVNIDNKRTLGLRVITPSETSGNILKEGNIFVAYPFLF